MKLTTFLKTFRQKWESKTVKYFWIPAECADLTTLEILWQYSYVDPTSAKMGFNLTSGI